MDREEELQLVVYPALEKCARVLRRFNYTELAEEIEEMKRRVE